MTTEHNLDPSHQRFDAAMRALHRDALAQVSPGVRWKLRPVASTRRRTDGPLAGWRMGAAFAGVAAAVTALALGVALWKPASEITSSAPAIVASSAADTQQDNAAAEQDALEQGTLEQDPYFYAWLASDDAALVAMESP